MKNIDVIQNSVFDFFNIFFVECIAILSGYPNKACQQPLEIKNSMIENSMKGYLIEENFQKNDWETIFINEIMNIMHEIDLIDIVMSTWVMDKTGHTTQELFTQYKQNIHCGKINEMMTKESTFPVWLIESDFQELILIMTKKIEKIIDLIEIFEERAIQVNNNILNRAITLSRDWKLKQNIKLLRCIIEKGIKKALLENVEVILNEKNPYEWLYDGFSQKVDDLIDKSRTLEPKMSIKLLHSAFRFKPKTVQSCTLFYELANNYEELQKWEEAIESYTQMLSVAPPNGIGLMNRAKIYLKQNRYAEAKNDLEDALKLPNIHLYLLREEDKEEIQKLLKIIENKYN